MRLALIDYENVHTLAGIDFSSYTKVIVFVGAQQNKLNIKDLCWTDKPFDISIIHVKETSKNNVDFHITYYLGIYHSTTPLNVQFDIISRDKGYDPIIKHISSSYRNCQRLSPLITSNKAPITQVIILDKSSKKMLTTLQNLPPKLRPTKEKSLRNYISTVLNSNSNEFIVSVLNKLLTLNYISLAGSRVNYSSLNSK